MTKQELFNAIKAKQSYLCVGLDTDIKKIPKHLLSLEDPIFEFNKQIIDATKDFCVAYKPNLAFYESLGASGWESLCKTLEYIPKNIFTIADAKRGDIGNTSEMYARTFFNTYNFDSVTVAPYMGEDSITPFLGFENKWVILLALTSNKGGLDFQLMENKDGRLFEQVIKKAHTWGNADNMMFVVGATRGEMFKEIRAIAPDNFLLVPGVGAQGGSLEEVSRYGMNKQCGLLVNSSRAIIYASSGEDFADKAKEEAQKLQMEMAGYLKELL
jgi:orotidine-5'-phosphate decarboxylase